METEKPKTISNGKFDFFNSFIEHLYEIFKKLQDKGFKNVDNNEYIDLGRTEDEKETIKEICEDLDTQCELMTELEASELTPKEWLKKKSEELLKDCDDDTVKEILDVDRKASVYELNYDIEILDAMAEQESPTDESVITNKDQRQ